MRVQWELLLGLLIINLSVGVVMGLALPGTAYASGLYTGTNATQYEQQFNSTKIATSWSGTPFSGIPIIGDIFAGFSFLYQNFGYLIDGLPMLLNWISVSYITDPAGQAAFLVIGYTLRAIFAVLITAWFIEFISGRFFTD